MKKLFSAFAVFSLFMFASCNKGYDANNEDPAYGTKTMGFTINKYGKQVFFSQGNLWYGKKGDESVDKLHFEENQWSTSPTSIGSMTSGHVSHFFWTDNLTNSVAPSYDNSGSSFFADEGHKQTVDGQSGWYALSISELNYLFGFSGTKGTDYRDVDQRFAKANVNGVNGLLIFPDGYTGTISGTGIATANDKSAVYPTASIPPTTWSSMEAAGCVFLPAAGYRGGSNVGDVPYGGYYWSSTASGSSNASYLYFYYSNACVGSNSRNNGYSVRLVRESSN